METSLNINILDRISDVEEKSRTNSSLGFTEDRNPSDRTNSGIRFTPTSSRTNSKLGFTSRTFTPKMNSDIVFTHRTNSELGFIPRTNSELEFDSRTNSGSPTELNSVFTGTNSSAVFKLKVNNISWIFLLLLLDLPHCLKCNFIKIRPALNLPWCHLSYTIFFSRATPGPSTSVS